MPETMSLSLDEADYGYALFLNEVNGLPNNIALALKFGILPEYEYTILNLFKQR